MLSLSVGPFALSLTHLALLASLGVALLAAHLRDRRAGTDTQKHVWRLWLLGLLVARVSFVAAYWPYYQGDWAQVVDIRDGGFLPLAGIAVVLAGAAWLAWQQPPLRGGLLAGVGCGLVVGLASSAAIDLYSQRTPLPATVLQRADGSRLALSHYLGQPMVVNLWATWCPPCRREMPVLAAAQRQYPHVRFVLINQGESVGVVANFVATTGMALNQMLFDPEGAFARDVGAMALPTTLFYSAQGQLVGTHMGELSAASLARGMKVLATPDPAPQPSVP